MGNIRSVFASFIPPILVKVFRQFFKKSENEWRGPFTSWGEAREISEGYDTEQILERVCLATQRVIKGDGVFERDSVVFFHTEYRHPVLTYLLFTYIREQSLHVLDFGGALGSSYFQHRPFLEFLNGFSWNVVEQPHFVDCGQKFFENSHLHFFYKIADLKKERSVNVVLLSSVLHYLEKPYEILTELMNIGAKILIIDRTPFHTGEGDYILVQHVPKYIYDGSYPCWAFSLKNLLDTLQETYRLSESWDCLEEDFFLNGNRVRHKGLTFVLKDWDGLK